MDPVIIAAIITGCSTIISALIAALVVRNSIIIHNNQKIKGKNNKVNSEIKNGK